MDPDSRLQLRQGPAVHMRIEIAQALEQRERRKERTLRIVAVCRGVAEIDEESVAEGLRHESAEALHGRQGQPLIAAQQDPEIFRIQLFGQVGEPDQIDELDREKAMFGRPLVRSRGAVFTHRTPPRHTLAERGSWSASTRSPSLPPAPGRYSTPA